jgi:hypothetical protein
MVAPAGMFSATPDAIVYEVRFAVVMVSWMVSG